MKYIGQSVPRVDVAAKVKGEAVFASDMAVPGQAYMKMLMARRPHAIVKRVDTSKAEALPGVLAVLTSLDVPCNEFGYYSYDQPVLCGPSSKPYADRVRYVGDRVAAVVAESEAVAAAARGLGEVMNMCLVPAVTAAVYDATGIWFDHFPLVPEEVFMEIHKGR